MYHRFSGNEKTQAQTLLPDTLKLDEQLRTVCRNHPVWTPDEHLAVLEGKKRHESCPVIITIDDGYQDVFSVAFPVFKKHKIPAAVFLATGFIDGTTWMWWDQIAYLCQGADSCSVSIELPNQTIEMDLTNDDRRIQSYHALADACRFQPNSIKLEAIKWFADQVGMEIPAQPPLAYSAMSWNDIMDMKAEGMVFYPHTVNHPILTQLEPDEVDQETKTSMERVEEMTGNSSRIFCYPQGGPLDHNAFIRNNLSQNGCPLAYIAYPDPAAASNRLTMPRYCASADSEAFNWQLCGADYLVMRLRMLLGKSNGPGSDYWLGIDPNESASQ